MKKAAPFPEITRDYCAVKIPGTTVTMEGFAEAHTVAPPKRPFVFDEEQVAEIALAVQLGMNTMLTGPSGCGKTEVVMQLAAQLGRPCVRFSCTGDTRVSQLMGQHRPAMIDGVLGLEYVHGDLVVAVREGYWFYVDEIDMASAPVLAVLHSVLEEGSRTLHIPETGETIEAHPDFHVFASGNTIGERAQYRARFAGTGSLNSALLGRFGAVILCDYPTEEQEVERVLCHLVDPHCEDMRVRVMGVCCVAAHLRRDKKFLGDFPTRSLIQWAQLIEGGGDNFRAFELAVLRKMESPTDRQVAKMVVVKLFDWGEAAMGKSQ